MLTTHGSVQTEQGHRLITRLGRHWGHKFPVNLTDRSLTIPFDANTRAELQASETGLTVRIEQVESDDASTLKTVIADHLQRFAKDQTLIFQWHKEG